MENAEQNTQGEDRHQMDIINSEDNGKKEEKQESTPQLFSQEEDNDSFKQEEDSKGKLDSLIREDEEEDFEIPAFLRKQKN